MSAQSLMDPFKTEAFEKAKRSPWEDDFSCCCSFDRLLCESFRKLGVPYSGVPIIRILLFRVLYKGPLFSEPPM